MNVKPKILAIIPARGGSKGIPRKNLKLLGGRPLIQWTIDAAKSSRFIDRLIVSSEDPEIIAAARTAGCDVPFVRPENLATDEATSMDVVIDVLEKLPGFDYVLLLQPTSPLRLTADIDGCIKSVLDAGFPAGVSVTESPVHPYWIYRRENDQTLRPIVSNISEISRRQDLPEAYVLNGALYFAQTNWILKGRKFVTDETLGYSMPAVRSIDIDILDDWEIAERALELRLS